jgi:hypothetical protein
VCLALPCKFSKSGTGARIRMSLGPPQELGYSLGTCLVVHSGLWLRRQAESDHL